MERPTEVLAPQGWFRVPGWSSSWSLNGFKAAGGRLFFLFRTGPVETPARSAVIVTDTRGMLVRRLDIPGVRVEQFAVEDSGRIMTRLRAVQNDREVVSVWDPSGALQSTFQESAALGFHAGRPLAVHGSDLVYLDAPGGQRAIPLPDMGPAATLVPQTLVLAPISGDRSVIVSRVTGRMAVVEGNSLVSTLRLAAPEIDSVHRDTSNGELVFSSIASDQSGHIFGVVSPFKGTDGPVVLEFDSSGELLAKYHMAPAALAELKSQTNPNGYSYPSTTVVVGQELFALLRGASDGLVVWYPL